jgi:hypothetical protein
LERLIDLTNDSNKSGISGAPGDCLPKPGFSWNAAMTFLKSEDSGAPGDCLPKPGFFLERSYDLTDDLKSYEVSGALGDCLPKPGFFLEHPNDLSPPAMRVAPGGHRVPGATLAAPLTFSRFSTKTFKPTGATHWCSR